MAKQLTKCDFCKHKTASGCAATPNSYYCREAQNEFYAHLAAKKQQSISKGKKW